jgi:hypothetical protein
MSAKLAGGLPSGPILSRLRRTTTEVCAAPEGVYTTGPELHLSMSALQRLVLLLEVSTPQGAELHLNVSALLRYVLLLEVSTPQGLELHLKVSALQRLVLLPGGV